MKSACQRNVIHYRLTNDRTEGSVVKRVFGLVLAIFSMPVFAVSAVLPQRPLERSVPLDLAIDGSRTALEACAARGSAATVEVVDLDGLTKVVLSADGAQTRLLEYARRKAYTVLHKGISSGEFGRSLGKLPAHPPPFEGDPNLIQYAGALPIMRGSAMIGTISVSGPTGEEDDEVCARAGLNRIVGLLADRRTETDAQTGVEVH